MFVADELSYDSIHENRDRVFRVTTHVKISDVDFDLATSQFPAAHALQSGFRRSNKRQDFTLPIGISK